MGTWVAIAIGMFVLGSIMALKPNGIDVRLDKFRMVARRLELHPKVIACPDWVRGVNNEYGRGMIAQYALVLDDMKLPEMRYQVIDGRLHADSSVSLSATTQTADVASSVKVNDVLDKEALDLPTTIEPLVKAVYSKANSIVIFWNDNGYVKPNINPHYDAKSIEQDLLALKARLQDWAIKLSKK